MTELQQLIKAAVPRCPEYDLPDVEAIMKAQAGDQLAELKPSKFAELAADAYGQFCDFVELYAGEKRA